MDVTEIFVKQKVADASPRGKRCRLRQALSAASV